MRENEYFIIDTMPIDIIISFFTASVILAISPGTDNIFVLVHSAIYGPKSGIIVTLGFCSGLIVHTTLAAVGVTTLFQLSSVAFIVLKATGALYLLYLSWHTFRVSAKRIRSDGYMRLKGIRVYKRGIIMNITNPRVFLFFVAFLPQFTNPGYGPVLPQFIILGALFILATVLVFGLIALLSSFLAKYINNSPTAQKVMNWIAGIVFAGIALKLLIT